MRQSHWIRHLQWKDGARSGCGPVGIYLIFALKNKGAKTVIVSEPTEERRLQAQGIADAVFDPMADDVVKECMDRTDEKGVDVTFDVAGAKPGLETALKALKYRGKHVNIAMWSSREVRLRTPGSGCL
jgi:threonine dehydrogenase-like Zn-dependent dehydrogenase